MTVTMAGLSIEARMAALEEYVPYGARYIRAIADEWHTASRLIRDGRADEADYFIGLAEQTAARWVDQREGRS